MTEELISYKKMQGLLVQADEIFSNEIKFKSYFRSEKRTSVCPLYINYLDNKSFLWSLILF